MPRRLPLALLSLALLPSAAPANGFGWFRRPAPVETRYYYYYSVPVLPPYYVLPPVVPPPIEVQPPLIPFQPPDLPVQPLRPLPPIPFQPLTAPIEPALPSQEPFVPRPMPQAEPRMSVSAKVSSFTPALRYDLYPTATLDGALPSGRFALTVWNLADRDVALRIDGRGLTLPRGRSTTVEVGRDFTWQADGSAERGEKVPDGQRGLTLTLRR
jgi:hypothetical protein